MLSKSQRSLKMCSQNHQQNQNKNFVVNIGDSEFVNLVVRWREQDIRVVKLKVGYITAICFLWTQLLYRQVCTLQYPNCCFMILSKMLALKRPLYFKVQTNYIIFYNSCKLIFPSISYYFHIPKNVLKFFPHTGKNRNRRKSNLLP